MDVAVLTNDSMIVMNKYQGTVTVRYHVLQYQQRAKLHQGLN